MLFALNESHIFFNKQGQDIASFCYDQKQLVERYQRQVEWLFDESADEVIYGEKKRSPEIQKLVRDMEYMDRHPADGFWIRKSEIYYYEGNLCIDILKRQKDTSTLTNLRTEKEETGYLLRYHDSSFRGIKRINSTDAFADYLAYNRMPTHKDTLHPYGVSRERNKLTVPFNVVWGQYMLGHDNYSGDCELFFTTSRQFLDTFINEDGMKYFLYIITPTHSQRVHKKNTNRIAYSAVTCTYGIKQAANCLAFTAVMDHFGIEEKGLIKAIFYSPGLHALLEENQPPVIEDEREPLEWWDAPPLDCPLQQNSTQLLLNSRLNFHQ